RGEHVLEDGIGQVGDRSDDLLASRAAAVAGEDLGASGIEALPCLARLGADGTGGRGWRRGRRGSFRDWTLGRRRHVASIAVRADGVRWRICRSAGCVGRWISVGGGGGLAGGVVGAGVAALPP